MKSGLLIHFSREKKKTTSIIKNNRNLQSSEPTIIDKNYCPAQKKNKKESYPKIIKKQNLPYLYILLEEKEPTSIINKNQNIYLWCEGTTVLDRSSREAG